ncbi:MAG: hypothetical protein AAGB12_08640 [Pseudomonadota bacterium]
MKTAKSTKDYSVQTKTQVQTEEFSRHIKRIIVMSRHKLLKRWQIKLAFFKDLNCETFKILQQVASEKPGILNQPFDFTNSGSQIEVVKHNLDNKDYLYLKNTLNANVKLLRATDFFNQYVADKHNAKLGCLPICKKQDIAGRLLILSMMNELREWMSL